MKKYLKYILSSSLLSCFLSNSFGQSEAVIPPSNRSTTSMEKNFLFYADSRFSVSQSGSAALPLDNLFDGNFGPNYSSAINPSDPYVLLIENLPDIHIQAGSWIGWTTRYYNPVRFKIEIYNIYNGANTWVTVADEQNYGGSSYIALVPPSSVGKIRYTFYAGYGPSGEIGISELFFIHPEATVAYDHLMVKYNKRGNVGIGTTDPKGYKLAVAGNMMAESVKVKLQAAWPDFVFAKSYALPTLKETEIHIKEKGHLPGIPSAAEVKANGIELGDMNAKLLQKIEELTLHLIEKDKTEKKHEEEIRLLKQQVAEIINQIKQ